LKLAVIGKEPVQLTLYLPKNKEAATLLRGVVFVVSSVGGAFDLKRFFGGLWIPSN
jgi:hypothetical protein